MKLITYILIILLIFGFLSIFLYALKLEDKISSLEELNIELFYEIQESRIKENFIISEFDKQLLVYTSLNKKLIFELNSDSTQILITRIY